MNAGRGLLKARGLCASVRSDSTLMSLAPQAKSGLSHHRRICARIGDHRRQMIRHGFERFAQLRNLIAVFVFDGVVEVTIAERFDPRSTSSTAPNDAMKNATAM
ncbi:hypothetical protein [Pelomonas aquatica]|uniref:Uncharacterized protein n=1 Tax=Pelomonas aquatica TaxID=431058 RepID=A0A9X4LNC7_9BURK|nr:hypothetical protein [Pelomonas aquatica]MCY4757284.1 hypothetical protein [Pelomonas aquatica]MDG0864145.1 hypothetical protein [Pelomonas aquatica]